MYDLKKKWQPLSHYVLCINVCVFVCVYACVWRYVCGGVCVCMCMCVCACVRFFDTKENSFKKFNVNWI